MYKYQHITSNSTSKNGLNLSIYKGTYSSVYQASAIHAEAMVLNRPFSSDLAIYVSGCKKPFPKTGEESLRIVMLKTSVTFSVNVLKELQACRSSLKK